MTRTPDQIRRDYYRACERYLTSDQAGLRAWREKEAMKVTISKAEAGTIQWIEGYAPPGYRFSQTAWWRGIGWHRRAVSKDDPWVYHAMVGGEPIPVEIEP